MIERILLASDGPGAWTAAAAVADLVAAAQEPVEVQVLHVNEVEYETPPEGCDSTDCFPDRRRLVEELVDDLRRRGIAASGKVRSGVFDDVADDIVDEAKSSGAGLIAMSCRPRSLLRYAFTGSVSQAVSDARRAARSWSCASPASRSDRAHAGHAVAPDAANAERDTRCTRCWGWEPSSAPRTGNVGSSIYYALGVVAGAALGLTPAVFVITGILFIATAWSYSEATAAMPEAGGASSFTRRAFNEFASFGIGWAQMLTYTATIAISALFVPQYLSIFWPILRDPPYSVIGGAITIIVLVVINIYGIKEAASLNVVLALLDLGTQVLIMIIALILLLEPNILLSQIRWGIAPTWGQFLYGLAIGTVAYTGIETISNMAEEAERPDKDVPRSINFVIIAVLVVYIGMPLAALSSMTMSYNQIAIDPATGKTMPVPVVPGEPEGTYRLKSDPEQVVYVPPSRCSKTAPRSFRLRIRAAMSRRSTGNWSPSCTGPSWAATTWRIRCSAWSASCRTTCPG